jgi:hypothetical protein
MPEIRTTVLRVTVEIKYSGTGSPGAYLDEATGKLEAVELADSRLGARVVSAYVDRG